MRSAAHTMVGQNPFETPVPSARSLPESPYCARIKAMWQMMRKQVLQSWTTQVRQQASSKDYMDEAQVRYLADAYHSLSIEGYQVTPEMIDRVRTGIWGTGYTERDREETKRHGGQGILRGPQCRARQLAEGPGRREAGHALEGRSFRTGIWPCRPVSRPGWTGEAIRTRWLARLASLYQERATYAASTGGRARCDAATFRDAAGRD